MAICDCSTRIKACSPASASPRYCTTFFCEASIRRPIDERSPGDGLEGEGCAGAANTQTAEAVQHGALAGGPEQTCVPCWWPYPPREGKRGRRSETTVAPASACDEGDGSGQAGCLAGLRALPDDRAVDRARQAGG